MKHNDKIFITGLPRTGTTSICAALLEHGFSVAHTAYTSLAMEQAQVIADTPIFCDFETLAKQYPDAKFIHLTRDLSLWLPSIKQLLNRMYRNVTRTDGGFNPTLKRCYQTVFSPLTQENINDDSFLTKIYQEHLATVEKCFEHSPERLLKINVADADSYQKMLTFLALNSDEAVSTTVTNKQFEKINVGGKITYWNSIKHPRKIDANLKR